MGYNPADLPSGPEAIARARRELAAIEAEILAGNADLDGLCLGLSDWSWELRRLLREQDEKSRRGETAAAGGNPNGDQAFTE
jgi:hypothetical protein